jgi:hypothetical protein
MRCDSVTFSLALPALASALSYNPTPTATIDAGLVVGTATALPNGLGPSVNQFLGIPFAQSPPERFSPPRNVSAFSKPINATAFKPACIQQFRCESCCGSYLRAPTDNCQILSQASNSRRRCSTILGASLLLNLKIVCISMFTPRPDRQAEMAELSCFGYMVVPYSLGLLVCV